MSYVWADRAAQYRSDYDAALKPGAFVGRLESCCSLDGEHVSWSIHLEPPRGAIVWVELADVFDRLEGKRVALVVTELPERVNG